MSINNLFFDTTNAMNYALVKAGGYTYINDRIPPNVNPDHRFVLETLIRLVKRDGNNGCYDGLTSLFYSDELLPPTEADNTIYNNNIAIIPNFILDITNEISVMLPHANGGVVICDENGKIIYESDVGNINTLTNARENKINPVDISSRSFIIAANISQTRIGHGIKRAALINTSVKTVYVSYALGKFGFNNLNIIYYVNWPLEYTPNFLK